MLFNVASFELGQECEDVENATEATCAIRGRIVYTANEAESSEVAGCKVKRVFLPQQR